MLGDVALHGLAVTLTMDGASRSTVGPPHHSIWPFSGSSPTLIHGLCEPALQERANLLAVDCGIGFQHDVDMIRCGGAFDVRPTATNAKHWNDGFGESLLLWGEQDRVVAERPALVVLPGGDVEELRFTEFVVTAVNGGLLAAMETGGIGAEGDVPAGAHRRSRVAAGAWTPRLTGSFGHLARRGSRPRSWL